MKAIDTNIIVRFLIKDDAKQSFAVKKMFETIEERGEKLWLSSQVVLEVIWVLRSCYRASREEILTAVRTCMDMVIFKFEDEELIEHFYFSALKSMIELDDLLIGLRARKSCEFTWTFDKNSAKSDLFKLLT